LAKVGRSIKIADLHEPLEKVDPCNRHDGGNLLHLQPAELNLAHPALLVRAGVKAKLPNKALSHAASCPCGIRKRAGKVKAKRAGLASLLAGRMAKAQRAAPVAGQLRGLQKQRARQMAGPFQIHDERDQFLA